MLQGYVINLDRHPQRLEKFNQHPDAKYFQRVRAVDKLDLEKVGDLSFLFDIEQSRKFIYRTLTSGEIACTLSHIRCWKAVAENPELMDHDFAIIAEDDLILVSQFSQILQQLQQPLTQMKEVDWVILQKLGLYQSLTIYQGSDLTFHHPTHSQHCDSDGSSLYLIRKSKAKQLLEKLHSQKPFWLADQFSYFCDLNKILIANQLLGYVNEQFESDLEMERELSRKK